MVDLAKLTSKRLGELLHEEGVVSQEQIQETLDYQADKDLRFGEAMIDLGIVEEGDIVWVLCTQFDLPYIKIEHYHPNPEALKLLDPEFLAKNIVFPIEVIDETLVLVVSSFFHREMFETIYDKTGKDIQIFLSTSDRIQEALVEHLNVSPNSF